MKILHILDHSLPLHSGYTFRSHNIFRTQKERGWELAVVTSPKHEAGWKGKWASVECVEGVNYYRTGAVHTSKFPFVTENRIIDALSRRIEAVAACEKPDILHAHSPVLNAIAALRAGKKLGLPVVYEIRAFWEDAAVDHGTYVEGSWKYRLTKALETWACRRVDHVAILCNGLKNDLIDRGIPSAKITPVFNGVNTENFTSTPVDKGYLQQWGLAGKHVIGFIGSFYHYEGLDLLVRSFAEVHKTHPETVLLMVGGGEMEVRLREIVSSLAIQDAVLIPGRVPHDTVPGIYSMIDILVYPRHSMRLTELVTPLKPLEAMAMGKVLVASDVGGHRELIMDNTTGILFRAGDQRALGATLRNLVSDSGLRERIAATASEWVREHHSWKKTTSVYESIYRSAQSDMDNKDYGTEPHDMLCHEESPRCS